MKNVCNKKKSQRDIKLRKIDYMYINITNIYITNIM